MSEDTTPLSDEEIGDYLIEVQLEELRLQQLKEEADYEVE